jgi:predicted enzyme related to lactoylglutathione lyase
MDSQASSGTPREIGVLLLRVHDFPKMLAFYRDALGLPLSGIHPGGVHKPLVNWARFEPLGTAIELFDESLSTTNPPPLPRHNALVIAFKVPDIRATYEELRRRGVAFPRGIGEEAWGWYVHFKDPEGNGLQLYQPRPGY